MQGSDSCFQVIFAQYVSRRCLFQEIKSPSNQIVVPLGSVLHLELDQSAVVIDTAVQAGGVETKKGKQGMGPGLLPLRVFTQEKRQSDGFETEVLTHCLFGLAAVVTLIEKQV